MRNENASLYQSMRLLKLSFETFYDAIEIAAYPLSNHLEHVAIRSRNRTALMLKDAVNEVIRAQHEEGN